MVMHLLYWGAGMASAIRTAYAVGLITCAAALAILIYDVNRLTDFIFAEKPNYSPQYLRETEFFKASQQDFSVQFNESIKKIHSRLVTWTDNVREKNEFLGIHRYIGIGLSGNSDEGYEPILLKGRLKDHAVSFSLTVDRARARLDGISERCLARDGAAPFDPYYPYVNFGGRCELLSPLKSNPTLSEIESRLHSMSNPVLVKMMRPGSVKYVFVSDKTGAVSSNLNAFVDNRFPAELEDFFLKSQGRCTTFNDCRTPFQGEVRYLPCRDILFPTLGPRIEPDFLSFYQKIDQMCMLLEQSTPVGSLRFIVDESIDEFDFYLSGRYNIEGVFSDLLRELVILPRDMTVTLDGSLTRNEFFNRALWRSLMLTKIKVGDLSFPASIAAIVFILLAMIDFLIFAARKYGFKSYPDSINDGGSHEPKT